MLRERNWALTTSLCWNVGGTVVTLHWEAK